MGRIHHLAGSRFDHLLFLQSQKQQAEFNQVIITILSNFMKRLLSIKFAS